MAGINVVPRSTAILQRIKGTAPLAIFVTDIPLILLQVFRHIPTGGVTRPIARPTIKIAPNCQSLTPIPRITGSRIGASIKIAGETSIKVPKNRISRSMRSSNTHFGMSSPGKKPDTI